MKKLLLLLIIVLAGFGMQAQDTISTIPTFSNNNGSSAVSFEVMATTSAIKIIGLSNYYNSGVTSTDVWIKQGAINGSATLVVNAANGWSQHQTGVTVAGTGSGPVWLQGLNPINVAAGDTVGIVLTGGMSYFTATGAPVTTFPGTFAQVNAGSLTNGFGGVVPNLTNDPRGFLGSVAVELDLLGSCTNAFANVTTDSILATSAQINWTPGTGNTSFWLEYGLAGFTPGTGTKITGSYPGAQPPVNLTGLSVNTDYDYYIGEICNSGADSIYAVSPYQFKTTKLCAPATNLAVTNILGTSADVSWSHAGGANSFTIYYGTGLSQSATSSPFSLTGLTSNTTYDVYVVADCGTTNGLSDSIGPVSFVTPCAIVTAPFQENFDGTTWVATGNNNGNSLDQCWSSSPATSSTTVFKWIPRSTAPTSGNGPLTDQTGTNFMYCEASGSASGNVAELISPQIDASGLNTPGLYFQQHRFSNGNIADMLIQVSNDFGTTWDSVYTVAGDVQTSNSAPWLLEFVNLAAYTGDTIMVKFVQTGNGCCGDAAIDNVEIKEAPTCPWPTGVNVPSTTSSSAIVSWNDPSGTSWDLEWGPVGFTQGTGNIKTTSSNPDTITGLGADTEYEVYVRANCVSGGNGFSIWIGPIPFRTKCSPFTAPYFNDFSTDIANTLPNCWSKIQTYGTGNFQTQIETEAFGTPYSTPNHLGIYNWTNFTATDNLAAVSPTFSDLTAGDKRINFFAKTTWAGNNLLIGTTSDGVTINYIDTIPFATANSYQQYFVDLDSANGYNGIDNQVVFAFDLSNTTNTFDWIYIDDFTFEQIPACNPPAITSLGAAAGVTTATLFWGSGSQGDKTEVQWGTPNFMQGTGILTGSTTVNGTIDTVNATGLTSNTQYEFWIRDSCNASGFSPWIGPFVFNTLCAAQSMTYTEDFTSWPPNCFELTSSNLLWDQHPSGHAQARFWNFSTGQATMKSPPIDITQKAQMKFKWAHLYSTFYPDDQLIVRAQVVGSTTWDTLIDLKGPTDFNNSSSGNTTPPASLADFTQELFYLDSATYVGNAAIFEFIAVADFGPNLYVDDFIVEAQPNCPDPVSLTATGIQGYQATASWSAASGSQYIIEYGPQGFTQATGGGIYDTTQTTSIIISGLTPVTCYDYYVMADCGNGATSAWVGPFTFCTLVSCPVPTNIRDSAKTTTTNIIKWDSGSASDWNISWGPAGTAAGAGTLANVTGTPEYALTGLTDCTPYTFWVRDSCGLGDVSLWAGPYDFTTEALTQSLPFSENFDFGLGCWGVVDGGATNDTWQGITAYGFASSTLDGTPFAHVDSDAAGSGAGLLQEELITPAIDASGTLNLPLTLDFDQFYNNLNDSAMVDVWDGTQWVNVLKQTANSGAWGNPNHQTIDISTYANAALKVRFRYDDAGVWAWYWAVDNVVITDVPSCVAPTALGTAGVTSNSASLNWTTGGATNWNLEYGPAGFVPGTGTTVTNASNPYALSGLTANTCYDFYVQDSCGVGDVSLWTGPFNFCTACTTYSLPWSDNLDAGSWVADNGTSSTNSSVDQCWSRFPDNTTNYSWRVRTTSTGSGSGVTGPATDKSGTGNYAYTEASSGSAGNVASLTSPLMDLSTATNPELTFAYHFYGTQINKMVVEGYDGTTWTALDSIVGGQQTSGTAAWIDTTVSLAAYAGTANFQFRLSATSNGCCAGDLAVDDFSVTDGPGGGSCVAPTGLATSNVTCTDADMAWTSDAGTLLTFVRFDTTGFNPATGGTLLINPTSPATLTGLMPGTTYDVWVADSCSSGTAATMYTFTTPSAPQPSIAVSFNQTTTTATTATVDFDASATLNGNTYSWDFGGGNMATGATASFTYAANGSFPVTLTVTNGCGSVDSTFSVNVQGISIEETALGQSLNVFPNPNDGNFNVSFTLLAGENVELRVLNSAGQIVMKKDLGNIDRYDGNIDLSTKAKGMYILQIETTSGTVNRRLTIQ